ARPLTSLALFVAPLAGVNVFELQRLLEQLRLIAVAAISPCRHVRVVFVVALRFAFGRLIFLAEVAAAGLIAVASVDAHQFRKLKEIRDATRLLQALVQVLSTTGNID